MRASDGTGGKALSAREEERRGAGFGGRWAHALLRAHDRVAEVDIQPLLESWERSDHPA